MKFLVLLVSILPLPVFAFTLNSSGNSDFKGWTDPNITFNVNASNCPSSMDIPGLISEAVAVWNNVPTSRVKISYNGSTSSTTFASPTTVYCETSFQTVTGADQNYVPAAAAINPSGNYVGGGVLLLNVSAGSANISGYDHTSLLIIIAHEVGHILGLGHSQDPSALMYYNASAKTSLTLAQDDMDGVSYLYPRNELSGDKMMGCGLVSSHHKPPRSGMLALLALLFATPVGVYATLRMKNFDTQNEISV